MRYEDNDEAERLNAEPWQLALLKANPPYCGWGPHEDYMCSTGESWKDRVIVPTWAEFGPWKLDDLNECVNFYFDVNRASEECKTCGGNGYHPLAQGVANTFYSHMNPAGECWSDNITQDEVQALVDAGRLKDWTHEFVPGGGWQKKTPEYIPTAAEVNAAQSGFRSHDAINRMYLIEARLKRLGLPHSCPTCEGHGYTYTEPAAHVSLVLWWLHPRKGCSRGIKVTRLQRGDLPAVQAFLKEAARRNAERFQGVGLIA